MNAQVRRLTVMSITATNAQSRHSPAKGVIMRYAVVTLLVLASLQADPRQLLLPDRGMDDAQDQDQQMGNPDEIMSRFVDRTGL
jgi:hypothetical protein